MSKLYCAYCHSVIDEDDIQEWWERTPMPGRDDEDRCRHECCPVCHEEGMFEDMGQCRLCGEEIIPDGTLCELCQEVIDNAWVGVVREAQKMSPHKPYKEVEDIIIEWLEWQGLT